MPSPPCLLIGQSSSFLFKFLRVLISVRNVSMKCESCPLSTRPLSSNASCATSDCGKLACGSMPLGPRQSPSSRSSNHGSTTHFPTTTTNRCLRETDNPASGKVRPRRLVFPASQPAEPQKWRALDSQSPIWQRPAMEINASSFKLRVNVLEGPKAISYQADSLHIKKGFPNAIRTITRSF